MKHLKTPDVNKSIESIMKMVDNYGKDSNIGKAYLESINDLKKTK